MKRILVASDLSARSERALRRAALLAKEQGAEISVVSVVDEDLPAAAAQSLRAEAERTLEGVCQAVLGAPAAIEVVIGEPVEAIVRQVEKVEADLLVVGIHRPRRFWDMFGGTTMERMIRATDCAVLVVRDAVEHGYERVLLGVDLSPACVSVAKAAAGLAPDASFTTFHAVHVPYRGLMGRGASAADVEPFVEEAAADLSAWWPKSGMPAVCARPDPEVGEVIEVLEAAIGRVHPDLLAVGAHGRPMLAPTFLGSLTESVLRNPPCDVLLVRR